MSSNTESLHNAAQDPDVLRLFVHHLPVAAAMFDRKMRYLEASQRWCEGYGVEHDAILGRSHYEVFPEIPERWKAVHRRVLEGEELSAEEDKFERADGSVQWLHWAARPWGAKPGKPEGLLLYTEDVTARKTAQAKLTTADEAASGRERLVAALFETGAQAILAVAADGRIAVANAMAERMFGYGPGELAGRQYEELIPEASRSRHRENHSAYMAGPPLAARAMGIGLDLEGRRKDGTLFPIEAGISRFEADGGKFAVAFVSDITVRKEQERAHLADDAEKRRLSRELAGAYDDASRRIARELHDDIAQQLAHVSMEAGQAAAGAAPETAAKLQAMQGTIQAISESVRRISHRMHPSIVEDLGLEAAVAELCAEGQRENSAFQIRFESEGMQEAVDPAVGTCLYRLTQECLRNIGKHSGATEAQVRLYRDGEGLHLRVSDNGKGFAATRAGTGRRGGLGLHSMRERVRLAGGTLRTTNAEGGGALVAADIPLERAFPSGTDIV